MEDRYRGRYSDSSDDYGDGFDRHSRRYSSDLYEEDSRRVYDDDYDYEDISSHSKSHRRKASGRSYAGRKKRTRFACVLLCLVLFVAGVLCLYAYKLISPINYVEVDENPEVSQLNEEGQLLTDSRVLNILLFGVDGDGSGGSRSDTMMLLSIDNRHKKLKMTSFQRDTFVYVPDPDGSYHTKLTNAYGYGGVGLSIATIEANYGIKIDRYATVNFETFKSIVDILGGVEIELTDREILYINCQIAQNNQTEYLDAQAGPVRLNGQQALWYARNRGGDVINGVAFYEGTDWDRTQRQRKFMEAVIGQVKDASLTEVLSVVNEVGPNITTNLKKTEIVSLVASSLIYLRYDTEQCSMPSEGSWGYEQNFAGDVIYVYDWDTARRDLAQFIYEDIGTD